MIPMGSGPRLSLPASQLCGIGMVQKMNGGCATDIGASRKVNQDTVFFRCMEEDGKYFALGAVCDGVGGLERGEVASHLVIKEMEKWFLMIAGWIRIAEVETDILYAHLLDAAEEWNAKVRDVIFRENLRTGTTMSVIMLIRDRYYIVQVGDSRIYRFHDKLEQLTVDASISKMKNGIMKKYLSNYMGKADKLWFSTAEGTIQDGDMFLFCSDGGYHLLTEKDVREAYRCFGKEEPGRLCGKLVKTVIARGEKDNVSIGIIKNG